MKLRHVVLLGIAFFLFIIRMRPVRLSNPRPATAPEMVRITQFYPAMPKIALGEKTTLCYGVENAKSVRLAPALEEVWPALVRCFEVSPQKTTEYTLTAADSQGTSVSKTTSIEVGPPRPKLLEVSVNKLTVSAGELVTVCFKAQNATKYDVAGLKPLGQQVAALKGVAKATPDRGCFADRPNRTTTYLVKVNGPGGEDSEKVTVTVK